MKQQRKAFALALCFCAGIVMQTIAMRTIANTARSYAQGNENSDAIQLSKTISQTPDENGNYTITLESYTTGAVTMGQVGNPLDIVLVLDQSSSMLEDFAGNPTTVAEERKQYALKNAAEHFVDVVHENAVEYGINHRIAIVRFHSTSYTDKEFTDVQKKKGYNAVRDVITNLKEDEMYETFPHEAMDHVQSLYITDTYEGTEARDKVVVFFSDGQPSMTEYGDYALETAVNIKKDYDADFYTIGTFAGADPNVISGAPTASAGEIWMTANENMDPAVANRFMNYLSSNSKKAESLGMSFIDRKDGVRCKILTEYAWANKGFYTTASDSESLYQMFDSVSHQIMVDAPKLDASGKLKDTLSTYFDFSEGFTSAQITLQTAACTGVDADGNYQWAEPVVADSSITAQYDAVTKSIVATGFDYAAQAVTKTSKGGTTDDFGAKLIVSFSVKAKDGFLGGNQVPSNTSDSGIYTKEDNLLKSFDVPHTDVPVQTVSISGIDHSVYLGNAVSSGEAVVLVGDAFNGVNNAYVYATVSVFCDKNGNGIIDDEEYSNPECTLIGEGDVVNTLPFDEMLAPETRTRYLVEVELIPTKEGSQPSRRETVAGFDIYVLVPEVTVQDVWVDYGVCVDVSKHCVQETRWQYTEGTPEDAPVPTAPKPEIRLVHTSGGESADDNYTAMSEKTFTLEDLQWQSTDGRAQTTTRAPSESAKRDFTVHLNRCNLTITKTVDAAKLAVYPQTFFFTATQGEKTYLVSMSAQELASGTCSKSIVGFYAGQPIAVDEDSAWAWRYQTDTLPASVLYQNLEADGTTPLISTSPVSVGEKSLTVENELCNTSWQGAEETVVNRFTTQEACA